MISYETYCRIKHLAETEGLNVAQISESLGISRPTVETWLAKACYQMRQRTPRKSKLDPYKDYIVRLLEKHPYTAVQILQRIREQGYQGGRTIVKDYVQAVRPPRRAAYLTLSFAPGECAQVDWGSFGSITVGSTKRKLSFFLMVLCYSRRMYLEFTVLQTMEHFLNCHKNAFEYFGGIPGKIMLDNLKSAVLLRLVGQAPVFNPRYADFARHYGFNIAPCNVGKGNEKGVVENGVGYVKKNILAGLESYDFASIHPIGRQWLEEIANVRIHGETKRRPVDLFGAEKAALKSLPVCPYDVGTVLSARASSRFRVVLDSNRYSVPAEYAGARLTLKAYPDIICVYSQDNLIARHPRSYDRHQDYEHPDHPKALLAQRRKASEQRLYAAFLALTPNAENYYNQLAARRLNPRQHVQKIVALSQIHGPEPVARAIEDAFALQAFSCEYIANLLECRARTPVIPAALQLTRRQDLLDLDVQAPDLSLYQQKLETTDDSIKKTE